VRTRSPEENALKSDKERISCSKCNLKHEKGKCLAYGKRCHICLRFNHFAKACREGSGYTERKKFQCTERKIQESEDYAYSRKVTYYS
jgi:hypothetical protein